MLTVINLGRVVFSGTVDELRTLAPRGHCPPHAPDERRRRRFYNSRFASNRPGVKAASAADGGLEVSAGTPLRSTRTSSRSDAPASLFDSPGAPRPVAGVCCSSSSPGTLRPGGVAGPAGTWDGPRARRWRREHPRHPGTVTGRGVLEARAAQIKVAHRDCRRVSPARSRSRRR